MGYMKKHAHENDMTLKALEEFSSDLSAFLNPVENVDMPIICIGLITAYRTIESNMPERLKKAKEIIESEIKSLGVVINLRDKTGGDHQ